jgi:hypothetical protein
MSAAYRNKFLFIDDAFLLEVHNLRRTVNQAVKHPEPVVKLDAPWDTNPTDSFNYINVLYDPDEDVFKMWYVVAGRFPGQYWERGRKTAYAVSSDGIHWEKPILNRVEIDGSTENNYILPEMLSLNFNLLIDPSDIPSRRYKITFTVESKESRWAEFHSALCLAWSADGLDWERPVHVNPVLRGVSDDLWGFQYDPDRRKYQLYTRRVPNLPRDISLYESHDLVNWEDLGRVLVGGDELDPPEMFNLHGMAPFFYEDYCLGLLGTMMFLPGDESHTVFNRPPPDWPRKDLGILDVQLAYSRDGVRWSRPDDRAPVLPAGEDGAPDGGCLVPARNGPIVKDGETWIYYNASAYRHTFWSQQEFQNAHGNDVRESHCCMLAKMPEDHWVSLDAGETEGWLLTTPYAPPSNLLVNADAGGGLIEAEFRTPYDRPVEGFTRADCIGVSGNGKDQEIRWKSSTNPRDLLDTHRGGLSLKFFLRNAKLYSYSLMEPDPDGSITRYWNNARWCQEILHRSGNWDRNTNQPAGGVPQTPRPQTDAGMRFGPNPAAKAKWT